MWNGAEWTIEDGWFDPVGKHYLYDIKDYTYGGHGSHSGIPEEELTPTDGAEEAVNEEVDIGWDLEAMRDDAERRIRERDAKDKLDGQKIVFNGREMRKKYAKHLIRNAERDDVISLDRYKELLNAFDQAKPGDELDIPEMEKYLKGWFV